MKAELNKALAAASRAWLTSSPFLRSIKRHFQHEGNELRYTTMDGEPRQTEYRQLEESISATAEQMSKLSSEDVFKMVLGAAESVARQATQGAFETLNAEIEAAGNAVGSADPTSPEAILAVLERISIDFDDDRSKPKLPTLICHPSAFPEIERRWNELTEAERVTYERRHEEILDGKYAEYVSRENARALVD